MVYLLAVYLLMYDGFFTISIKRLEIMKKLYKFGLGIIFASLLVACSDDAKESAKDETSNKAVVETTTTETETKAETATETPAVSEQNEETSIYELQQSGVTVRITLVSKGDKILLQESDSIIPYATIGATNAAEAEQILSAITNNIDYSAIKGITYNMTYNDKEAHETITIDLTKADFDQLANLPGSDFNNDPEEGVSYSETTRLLENTGFKKVQ